MTFSTAHFAELATGVGSYEGVDARDLAGGELFGAHRAFAEAFVELKRLYAPLAAQVSLLSAPGSGGFARVHGYASAEKLIAAALGGTLGEARMLVEAGLAALAADEDPGGDGPGDDDDDDDDDDDSDGTADDERARLERERARAEAAREAALARERARRAALTPLARALEDRQISTDAAAVIRRTLESLTADTPELERRRRELEELLVRRARRLTLTDLRTACERAAARFDADRAADRARRLFESRSIYFSKQADGSVRVSGVLDPVTASGLMAVASDYTTRQFRTARDLDVPEPRSAAQMRADALAMMAEHILGCGQAPTESTATILVQVDLADLVRESGVAVNHTTGTTMFAGDVRRWCAQAGIIPIVMGGASLPLDVGRAERLATPAQRRALTVRDGGCVWCDAPPAWCDAHHLTSWADGGVTDLENLVLLCRSCHTRVHSTGWRVKREEGRTVIVPPPDEGGDAAPIPSARERTESTGPPPEARRSAAPDPGGGGPRTGRPAVGASAGGGPAGGGPSGGVPAGGAPPGLF